MFLFKQDNFPKKEFINGTKKFGYTSYLNFTSSVLDVVKGVKIVFSCIFCDHKQNSILGATSNIKTHLETHKSQNKDLMKWFTAYDKASNTPVNKYVIDNETMRLIRYFIASNTAAINFALVSKICSEIIKFQCHVPEHSSRVFLTQFAKRCSRN